MIFEVRAWHWTLRAIDTVRLAHAGNTLRGALGYALAGTPDYARWFRPEAVRGTGPSGLADPPRPFVLRAMHLDNAAIPPGSTFSFDLHSFETQVDRFLLIRGALAEAAKKGIGIGRGRAELLTADPGHPIQIALSRPSTPTHWLRVHYLTPTELKGGDVTNFATLLARARDRVATLSNLYGGNPFEMDFRGLTERAAGVRTVRADLHGNAAKRTSTHTGQTHSLGGVTGVVDFEGELTEFVPWLEAAQWTGVGRQTVWGKGAIRTVTSMEAPQPSPTLRTTLRPR